MNKILPGGLAALLLAGCAGTPPRNEKQSPQLAPTQVSDLQKRAKTSDQLGVDILVMGPSLRPIRGFNGISRARAITVPLIQLPASASEEPGARYRVPCVLAAVNGREDQRLLLDSGSNRVLLGYSQARSLDVPLIAGLDPVPAHGIGGQGKVDAYWAVVPGVNVGKLELRKLLALVAPDAEVLTYRRSFWGNMQVMIVGLNVFRGLSYLSLDYLNGRVTFESEERYLPEVASTFVTAAPLRWEGDLPVVDVVLERRYHTSCVLDTGGDYGLFVPRAMAAELGYGNAGWGNAETSRGIAGEAEGKGYFVHEVKVGEAIFRQVPARTRTAGPDPVEGRVLLGNHELRRYRVTFDFKKSVVWLEQ